MAPDAHRCALVVLLLAEDERQATARFDTRHFAALFRNTASVAQIAEVLYRQYVEFISEAAPEPHARHALLTPTDHRAAILAKVVDLLAYFYTNGIVHYYQLLLAYLIVESGAWSCDGSLEQAALEKDRALCGCMLFYVLFLHNNVGDFAAVLAELRQLCHSEQLNRLLSPSQLPFDPQQLTLRNVNSQFYEVSSFLHQRYDGRSSAPLDVKITDQVIRSYIDGHRGTDHRLIFTLTLLNLVLQHENGAPTLQEVLLLLQSSQISDVDQFLLAYETCALYTLHNQKEEMEFLRQLDELVWRVAKSCDTPDGVCLQHSTDVLQKPEPAAPPGEKDNTGPFLEQCRTVIERVLDYKGFLQGGPRDVVGLPYALLNRRFIWETLRSFAIRELQVHDTSQYFAELRLWCFVGQEQLANCFEELKQTC